jgi:ribosomal protein S13
MELKVTELLLDPSQRIKTDVKPIAICLHHTAGWDDPVNTVKCWNADTIGRIGTHYVIGGQSVKNNNIKHDGKVVRCIPDIGWNAWHLGGGPSGQALATVGIEICSAGALKGIGSSATKKTWFGVEADSNQICRLNESFRGTSFYHRYSDKQLASTQAVIRMLADIHSIDIKQGLVELLKNSSQKKAFAANHLSGAKVRGLYTHTNFRADKSDCFPQPEFIDMILSL